MSGWPPGGRLGFRPERHEGPFDLGAQSLGPLLDESELDADTRRQLRTLAVSANPDDLAGAFDFGGGRPELDLEANQRSDRWRVLELEKQTSN